jgi:hypothetical protein
MHGVRIVRRRQQIDQEQAEVNMLNFSIGAQLLGTPAPAASTER